MKNCFGALANFISMIDDFPTFGSRSELMIYLYERGASKGIRLAAAHVMNVYDYCMSTGYFGKEANPWINSHMKISI